MQDLIIMSFILIVMNTLLWFKAIIFERRLDDVYLRRLNDIYSEVYKARTIIEDLSHYIRGETD